MTDLRDRLRSLPTLVGSPARWDLAEAPCEPRSLFVEWLGYAIDAGVPEPHAATLSTVDGAGHPDARVLILKDVTAEGSFEIATSAESAKGRQLEANPWCALTFYWTALARAVRIRGEATRGSAEDSARDFLARHPDARALVLAHRQSEPVVDESALASSVDEARVAIDADPLLVSADWSVWRIEPASIEFWQGSPSRDHIRLRYDRTGDSWVKQRLQS
ncbi:pyridoxal 5'-phosphate synthase [Planctomonas sp. JC2975]|uniref:pyridoxine/pyridoxamine 5'-phosphate oxidase n=1 Tax=Planctomonas sp. JC2975 TaxID=2729626 RepID=UPI001475EEED|nr:pyridoxal 5'-phosphate synthase [Planctomonas sp. JC2975]NNC12595.1 pyridoxal 5'-phosphate synthase [Planctomonas sp. JC2975]